MYGVSGTGTRLDANPTESGENIAKLSVVLGASYNKETEAAVDRALRKTMAQYPGIEVKFGRPQLFSFSTPLEIEIARLRPRRCCSAPAASSSQLMQNNPHFADVKSSVEQGYPEVQIRFDQDRAAALGLTTRQIADQVVRKVRGEVATRYSFRDRKIDVLVRGAENDRASVEDIRRPDRQSAERAPGDARRGRRRDRDRRPERDPPLRPGARRDRLGEPARRRPRHRGAGSQDDAARESARRRRRRAIGGQSEELDSLASAR